MKQEPAWTPIDYCKFDLESQAELHRAAIREWDQLTLRWEQLNEERKAVFRDLEEPTKDELFQEMVAEHRAALEAFEQMSDFVDRYLRGVSKTWVGPRHRPR